MLRKVGDPYAADFTFNLDPLMFFGVPAFV
jgi:hypothetical protein